jgi:hypothetical protein
MLHQTPRRLIMELTKLNKGAVRSTEKGKKLAALKEEDLRLVVGEVALAALPHSSYNYKEQEALSVFTTVGCDPKC